ncbi:hypothetical protein TWF281_007815 [Arthrobotrys megalospora]
MKPGSFLTLGAILVTASAIPVEGVEGGIVVQGGNADTRLGMFFKPIKNILENAADKKNEVGDSDPEKDSEGSKTSKALETDIVIAEVLPEHPVQEETIVIMDSMPTAPELIMPGLLNMLSPQRISPPSPVEQALDAVEEVLQGLRRTGITDGAEIDLIEVDITHKRPAPASELPDLLSMLEPMMEPTLPRMNAGDAMMIEIM